MKKNILLLFFSVCFTLVLFEIGLRLVEQKSVAPQNQKPKDDWALVQERIWTEHHPLLGWYHQRNKEAILQIKEQKIPIHTNSQGFRGKKEYTEQKPKATYRVVVLGDSFVFGWGVEDHETFSALMDDKSQKLEVLNLGIPGYGIDQILMTFRAFGKNYQPDTVVIGIYPEDFWRATRAFADTGHAKPYFKLLPGNELELQNVPVPEPFTLRTNQFPPVIEYGPVQNFLMQSLTYRLIKRGLFRLGKNLGFVDPDTSEEWRLGQVILKQLVQEIKEVGAHPVIVLVPPKRWVTSDSQEALHESLLRFLKREKIDSLDLTESFKDATNRFEITDLYIPDDWHWTQQGHEVTANTLLQFLGDRDLLPAQELV